MSKMFVGGCWYFLEKCWKAGGKRTRCPRQPIVDMDVDCRRPRHDENYSSLFVENSHPETLHRDMCIACSGSSWILPMYSTNFQFCKGLWCYTILNPFAFRQISTSSVWRKNSKNNEFRTKKFPNPEFLYGISSFCTLSENNSFLHGKISYFCIFLVKNRILNTEFSAMSHAIHKIVSKERCQSYFIDGCRVCPLDAQYKNRTK